MIVTEVNERTVLACRMGGACGVTKELPKHCGEPMVAVEEGKQRFTVNGSWVACPETASY